MSDYVKTEIFAAFRAIANDSTCPLHIAAEIDQLISEAPIEDITPGSRWISTAECLPKIPEGWEESPEPVLFVLTSTGTMHAGYYGENGIWRDKYFRKYNDSYNGFDASDVAYWMYQSDLTKDLPIPR